MDEKAMELRIYKLEERLQVAAILVKNGYTVSQGKRASSPGGKTVDYFLRVTEDNENAVSSK